MSLGDFSLKGVNLQAVSLSNGSLDEFGLSEPVFGFRRNSPKAEVTTSKLLNQNLLNQILLN